MNPKSRKLGGAKVVVVASVNGVLSCLYLCSGDSRSWTIPGGGMEEKDNSPMDCALRELEEEAGMRGNVDLIDGISFLHVYEGDPNSYTSPRKPDPHDTSKYTRPYGEEGPIRKDAYEHIEDIWVPLDQSPGRYIRDNANNPPRGRCDAEYDRFIRPHIDKIKEMVPELVSEQYTLKARLL